MTNDCAANLEEHSDYRDDIEADLGLNLPFMDEHHDLQIQDFTHLHDWSFDNDSLSYTDQHNLHDLSLDLFAPYFHISPEEHLGDSIDLLASIHHAVDHSLYVPGAGVPLDMMGLPWALHGLDVDLQPDGTLDELEALLENSHDLVVGLDLGVLWEASHPDAIHAALHEYPGIPGQSTTYPIRVSTIDRTEENEPQIGLSSPFLGESSHHVSGTVFNASWLASGFSRAAVVGHGHPTREPSFGALLMSSQTDRSHLNPPENQDAGLIHALLAPFMTDATGNESYDQPHRNADAGHQDNSRIPPVDPAGGGAGVASPTKKKR